MTVFEGQPGKAALYSLILPGAGQIYNKRYWKAPIVWAAEGAAAYFLIDRIRTYNNWNECYVSLIEGPTSPLCGTVTDVDSAFRIRQSARSNKELAWVFMSLAHLLNAIEAFIDRHLINFDTSEQLSYQIFPQVERSHFDTAWPTYDIFTIRIPLNR